MTGHPSNFRLAFLWPLSIVERTNAPGRFLRDVFSDPSESLAGSAWTRQQYVDCVTAGGYPEVLSIGSGIARRAWYESYLSTVINRDIQDFATITRADAIAKLLRLITSRAGSLAVLTDLAQAVEMARETTKNYLSYLDMVYLTMKIPAWSTNCGLRLVKTPKLYTTDSGLAAHLLGADADSLAEPGHAAMGPLVETFVAGELLKACSYSDQRISLFHLRTSDKHEVDVILEGPAGRVVAIEVKASTSPGTNALRELRWLRAKLGDRMHAGILLHLGTESASHSDGIYTMPLSALWDHEQLPHGTDSTEF